VPAPRKYPDELRERALRLVQEAMNEDPQLSAYVQAQSTRHADRAVVAAYEGFADKHADRYQDVRTRVDLGKGTTAGAEFARVYEELAEAQVAAA
jgi:hypothetical protein